MSSGAEMSMLAGNVAAILTGGVFTLVVSLVTNRHFDPSTAHEVWENTRDIDNPLSPWTEQYARYEHIKMMPVHCRTCLGNI